MLPGKPIAMMMFKSWGYMLTYNSLQYVSDMKIGHYMKSESLSRRDDLKARKRQQTLNCQLILDTVPPRSMYRAQIFAVLWLSIVQTATFNWMFGNLPDVCTPDQPQGFTCNAAKTFYNASVIWGMCFPA